MTFDRMWSSIEPIGREASTGGYRRYAWTGADATLREWFAAEAAARAHIHMVIKHLEQADMILEATQAPQVV